MDRQIYTLILTRIVNRRPVSLAVIDEGVALPDFYSWMGAQPDAVSLQASLYQAAADARRSLADHLMGELSRRIDAGHVTDKGLAGVEVANIKRLSVEAGEWERQADKLVAQIAAAGAVAQRNAQPKSWMEF